MDPNKFCEQNSIFIFQTGNAISLWLIDWTCEWRKKREISYFSLYSEGVPYQKTHLFFQVSKAEETHSSYKLSVHITRGNPLLDKLGGMCQLVALQIICPNNEKWSYSGLYRIMQGRDSCATPSPPPPKSVLEGNAHLCFSIFLSFVSSFLPSIHPSIHPSVHPFFLSFFLSFFLFFFLPSFLPSYFHIFFSSFLSF